MTTHDESPDLKRFLISIIEDEEPLSDDQLAAFRTILRSDAAARKYFGRHMTLHAMMEWANSSAAAPTDGKPTCPRSEASSPTPTDDKRISPVPLDAIQDSHTNGFLPRVREFIDHSIIPYVMALVVLVGICVAIVVSVTTFPPPDRDVALQPAPIPPAVVASLIGMYDTNWDGRAVAKPYELRVGDPLELKRGFADVIFDSGARVILEGPCRFVILDREIGSLTIGKLIARVPPQAIGFKIRTPSATITDLGTEFGLVVEDEGGMRKVERQENSLNSVRHSTTEVHVLGGLVDVEGVSPKKSDGVQIDASKKLRLMQGEAATFSDSKREVARMAAATSRFERSLAFADTAETLIPRQVAPAQRPIVDQRQQAYAEALAKDEDLLVYYTFDELKDSDMIVRNLARSGAHFDVELFGVLPTEGRRKNLVAANFNGLSDRIHFNVPGMYKQITLAAWVNLREIPIGGIVMFASDGWAQGGQFHWKISGTGQLDLTLMYPTGFTASLVSPPQVPSRLLGGWIHLAVVCDPATKQASHYLNGQSLGYLDSQTLRGEATLHEDQSFVIGPAAIGAWQQDQDNDTWLGHLNGRIDELLIFRRALAAAEIRKIYEDGR